MTVRRLGAGETSLLDRVVLRFRGAHPGGIGFLESAVVFVAEHQGLVVGWAYGYRLPKPTGQTDLLLYEIEVDTDHRRRGHGGDLVKAMIGEAETMGYARVWLLADADDEGAQRFYRSLQPKVEKPQILFGWPTAGES